MRTNTLAQQIFDALQKGPMTAWELSDYVDASGADISSACSRMAGRGVLNVHERAWSDRCQRRVMVWALAVGADRPLTNPGRPMATLGPPAPSRSLKPEAQQCRTVVINGREFEIVREGAHGPEGLTTL